MRAAILVVSAAKKGVSSTSGMQATVATSELFSHRANVVVPKRMKAMRSAIQNRDFELFAKLTMADSNQFHAVCLDTLPPIFYLNDVSHASIRVVEEMNRVSGKTVAAYTFDAGPNCVIYYEEENELLVLGVLKLYTSMVPGWSGRYERVEAKIPEDFNASLCEPLVEGVSRVILTGVGEGPVKTEVSLMGDDGLPLNQ